MHKNSILIPNLFYLIRFRALIYLTIGFVLINSACVTIGIIMYAKYHDCDPLSAKVRVRLIISAECFLRDI